MTERSILKKKILRKLIETRLFEPQGEKAHKHSFGNSSLSDGDLVFESCAFSSLWYFNVLT